MARTGAPTSQKHTACPFSSVNADSYALAIAAMFWSDRFQGKLPPMRGRPPAGWWSVPEPPPPPSTFFVEEGDLDLDLEQASGFSHTQTQSQSEEQEQALHTWFEPRRPPPAPAPDFDASALRTIQIVSVAPTLVHAVMSQGILMLLLYCDPRFWTRVLLPLLREDMARRLAARAALYDEMVG